MMIFHSERLEAVDLSFLRVVRCVLELLSDDKICF